MTEGFIQPSLANLAALAQAKPDAPIQMLNFVRFRASAEYPDGHEHADKGWSGQRAYQQYGIEIAAAIERADAKVVWQNNPVGTIIGPDGEVWHAIFSVEYPNVQAFQTMVSDPEYLAGAANRTAALEDSRLYLTQPDHES